MNNLKMVNSAKRERSSIIREPADTLLMLFRQNRGKIAEQTVGRVTRCYPRKTVHYPLLDSLAMHISYLVSQGCSKTSPSGFNLACLNYQTIGPLRTKQIHFFLTIFFPQFVPRFCVSSSDTDVHDTTYENKKTRRERNFLVLRYRVHRVFHF